MDNALTPRKRPRQKRSEATVETILDGAARILETGGLEAFNTNAVASRAGVSVGSLYQYYPGKDAVMAALVRRDSLQFSRAVAAANTPQPGESWRAAVDRVLDVAVAHQLDSPRLARIIDFEEARLPLDAEAEAADMAIRDVIVGLLRRGPFGDLDLEETATDLLNISRALIDAAGRHPSPDRQGLKTRVARAVFGYLGLPPT